MKLDDRSRFILRNLIRGLLWLTAIIVIFFLIKKYVDVEYYNWLEPIYDNPAKIYTIFIGSELLFGILPPELFMIWAIKGHTIIQYFTIILFLTGLSYTAGLVGFGFGRYLNSTRFYAFIRSRLLKKYEAILNKFGIVLIIVAALTPIPYSGICMLVGAVKYPTRKFLMFSSFRIVRFVVYSLIIWEANTFTI